MNAGSARKGRLLNRTGYLLRKGVTITPTRDATMSFVVTPVPRPPPESTTARNCSSRGNDQHRRAHQRFDHTGGGWKILGLGRRVSGRLSTKPPCQAKHITTTSPQSTHPNIAPTSPESNCGGRGGDTYRVTAYRTSHSSRRQPPANRPWPQTSRIHSQLVCGIWKVRGTDSVVWGWGS